MSDTYTALEVYTAGTLIPVTLDGLWETGAIVPLTVDGYDPAADPGDYTPPTFGHADQITESNVGHAPWARTLTLISGDFLAATPDTTYQDLHITGQVSIGADNVTFQRCWIEGMVTNYETGHHFELWDTTVGGSLAPVWLLSGSGPSDSGQGAVGRSNYLAVRCLIQDIDEGPRLGISTEVRDSYIRRIHLPDPLAHCDAAQTYGAGLTGGTGMKLVRVRFDARMYDNDRDLTGDWASSCYQSADGHQNTTVTVQDCLFRGGTYGLRLYDATVGSGLLYVATGNRFVRDSFELDAVSLANNAPGALTWSDNAWSDGEPIVL